METVSEQFTVHTDQEILEHQEASGYDMAKILGQQHVKRALEVAAAGGHHILLCGPAGSGKTLLAHTLPSILPPPTPEGLMEFSTPPHASVRPFTERLLPLQCPFRTPSPSISLAELVGDTRNLCPGEVSLAHQGVLLLDELPAFDQQVIESLCQPLAERLVQLISTQGMAVYPAQVLLVATMKPCPCGWINDPAHPCQCSATAITRYRKRLSRRLLAYFDLFIEVPRIAYEHLTETHQVETSVMMRTRVEAVRTCQRDRLQGTTLQCNAQMRPAEVQAFCKLESAAQQLLKAAIQQLSLSAHGAQRVLKIARTIADMAGSEMLAVSHIAESLWYHSRTCNRV